MSFLVFTCHLYYAPLKRKSGPKFCEFSVNNKRAGPHEVQASSLQKDIRYGRIQYHDRERIEYLLFLSARSYLYRRVAL